MGDLIIRRRQLLAGTSALGLVAATPTWAATFPSQTINFIIPYGSGGGFDAYGRKFSELLAAYFKKSVNVEPINMPGAAGREAIFELSRDTPDGYNISLANVPGLFLQKSSSGPDLTKMTWLANLGRDSYGLAVSAKSSIKTIDDLKQRSKKGVIGFASTGSGSTDYFATKVLASVLGLNIKIVSGYKGSMNSAVAVARGDVDAVVHSLTTLEKIEKAGLIRVIFVFQKKSPLPGVEDATSINQPDLGEIFQWRPVVAPPALPDDIAETLSSALVAAAKSSDASAWASEIHTSLYPLDQKQTLDMILKQKALADKWRSVL